MNKLLLFLALLPSVTNAQEFITIPVISTTPIKVPIPAPPDDPIVRRNELAVKLLAIAKKHKEHPKLENIVKVIEVSEDLGQNCIPQVFKKEDFISLAWVESAFDPYSVGNDKEMGTWQVLEWKELLPKVNGTNPFDIPTNGEMMCIVLNWKYQKYHDYRKTMQAYNGLLKGYRYFNKVQEFKFEAWPELKPKPKKSSPKKPVIHRKVHKVKAL
jgi:hypothetical protein